MRFALTDDQVVFRNAVRDLLAKEPKDKRVTWDALVDMGVTTVLIPESDGGLGLDEMTLVPVLEQTGYAALAFPVVETAMVAAPRGLADAGAVVALADGALVAWADRADVVLGCDGREIPFDLLSPADAVDPSRPVHRIGRPPGAPDEDVVDHAALGTAAQLVGLGQAMLDLTVAYVKERRQFGVPVGSFQAVKHQLANGLKELSFARPRSTGRRTRSPREPRRRRATCPWRRRWRPTRRRSFRVWPCSVTAPSATPLNTTCTCGSSARGRSAERGATRPGTVTESPVCWGYDR